ncbi:MAG: nucleotidyl transferase AbiEii/AbiGii toxin family protein [Gammaproteobacteria bacterium]|jgi:predicted nucleotidyltransferase component of viral defense system
MKTLENKIREESLCKRVRWDIIEKDYALSYVLFGIAKQPQLSNTLIFKGGTALKKCYFGDYRFSEDLDFSTINAPKDQLLEDALANAMQISNRYLIDNYGPFDIQIKRKLQRQPHPWGQEAFDIRVKFPQHPINLSCGIKIEITHDEPVILTPDYKSIMHSYDEPFDSFIACYPIEEIIAEKLRALLQTHEKLTLGKLRSRPRDYYDLWKILGKYGESIDKNKLKDVLQKKCSHRMVSYHTIDDFFTNVLVDETKKSWKNSLHLQLEDLPNCEQVIEETRLLIQKIF